MEINQAELDERVPARKRNKGFTLIELIIVIVILGILTTVVVLAVGGLRDEAESTTCEADAEALATAGEAFAAAGGALPATEAQIQAAGYIKDVSDLNNVAIAADGTVTVTGVGNCP